MKMYVLSLAVGFLVGEQLVPLAKRLVSSEPVSAAWVREQCVPHIFGQLPGKTAENPRPKNIDAPIRRVHHLEIFQ